MSPPAGRALADSSAADRVREKTPCGVSSVQVASMTSPGGLLGSAACSRIPKRGLEALVGLAAGQDRVHHAAQLEPDLLVHLRVGRYPVKLAARLCSRQAWC